MRSCRAEVVTERHVLLFADGAGAAMRPLSLRHGPKKIDAATQVAAPNFSRPF